jgi:DNA primase
MIPDHLIEEVRARADIVEIIGELMPLKRAGKDFRALCPFHHEKTPSFYVVPAKGIFKCFGCGESGDVFTFLMKRTGVGFIEAVRQVAAKVGVELPAPGRRDEEEEEHKELYGAIAFAADWFEEQLWQGPNDAGRRYLESRQLSREVAERYRLGYAPDDWRALREAAGRHGITDEALLAAGLIKEPEHGGEAYDRFRDRLIFPIGDVGGRLLAFGGRALRVVENVPKYLNSPETAVYHKGRVLYGLNWSRPAVRREGSALVVEGYMDYVSLAGRGIENVVAGMGTALTSEQANLIARYTAKAYLLYDSDAAGLRATFRTADALLHSGVHPLVVTLPPGEDPDSLVRRSGPPGLAPLLESAQDVLERKLQMLEERGFFDDIGGSRRALDRLLPTIRATLDPALRDIYVSRVADRTGVRRETLEQEAGDGSGRTGRWRGEPEPHRGRPVPGPAEPVVEEAASAAERLLLLLLTRDRDRIEAARAAISPAEMGDPVNRELFEALLGGLDVDEDGVLSATARLRLAELKRDPTEVTEGDRTFEQAVADLRSRTFFVRLAALDRRMAGATEAEAIELVQERQAVLRQLQELGSTGRMGFKVSPRYRRHARKPRGRTDGP